MALRDRVKSARTNAEIKRRTKTYGTHHAAVQAAARYCRRTGEVWDPGYGGRCELDKRALKQWGYELFVAPLKKVWQSRIGRTLLIGIPIAALGVLAGINGAWSVLLGVLLAVGLVIVGSAIALGTMGAGHTQRIGQLHDYLRDMYREDKLHPVFRTMTLAACTVGLPVILVSYALYRFFKRWGEVVGVVLAIIAMLLLLVTVVTLVWSSPMSALITVGWVIGVMVVIGCIVLIAEKLKDAIVRARQKRSKTQRIERNNNAYKWLEPLLKDAYEALYDKKRNLVSFEEWVDEVHQSLTRYRYDWADARGPYRKFADLCEVLWRSDVRWATVHKGNVEFEAFTRASYEAFLEAVWSKQHPHHAQKMRQREDRRRHFTEMVETVRNAWYAFKLGVCERVVLPPIEEVLGEPNENDGSNNSH